MFIDINTYVGHWPFRKLSFNTLKELDILAREYDITHMVVANLNGLFYKDANEANYELLEELKSYNGKTEFIPLAIVNPTYPAWERNARKMIELGFCGFELAPIYHGYSLAPEMLFDMYNPIHRAGKVMELAEELGVPVRICAGFENFRGRSDLDTPKSLSADDYVALISKYENVPVLATGFSMFAAGGKLSELVKARKNIFFDTTTTATLDPKLCARVKDNIPEEQICFGSLSPFNYMETNLLRISLSGLDEESIKANGARAFKNL
ncbi:MAG: amidohydrolase family protein [Oscillospiraceae bacterium]|nr:amidohydrolase family protein [Oscillospiraceae bacterium]